MMTARFRLIRSRQAVWSRRLSLFTIPLLLLAALLSRNGYIDPPVVLTVISFAVVLAALAVGLAISAFVSIWRFGHLGFRKALLGFIVGALVLVIPGYVITTVVDKPALNDVSTDLQNPPAFIAAARVRKADENPVAYNPANAAIQQQAYPGIEPVELKLSAEEVYRLVLEKVVAERWQVLDERQPVNAIEGRVEAVAPSLIFGFRDDVVITVDALGEEASVVNMRSASRYGRHDLGRNADRIYDFLGELIETASPMETR
ncbi:MAG: DUF1499 domain-containing protein [Rhodobiaceae bacterium]|nr:DUF1499 domain-containing protein [Rhodobiaceae bacterium]MCC0054757.1 DUF1499 domain-containing protein [Rhodobiaceae bacterium]